MRVSRIALLLLLFTNFGFSASQLIVFERDNGIWVGNLDGSAPRKIAGGNLPEISSDGTRVAFTTDEPSKTSPIRHIAVVEIASGRTTVFKDLPSDNSFGPVWSPDNKSLLFSIYIEGDWQLAFVNADGSNFRIVKKAEKGNESCNVPAWAPDGKSFYCHTLDSIFQFALDGTLIKKWDIHSILENGDMNSNSRINVSPDGKSLIIDIDMDEEQDRENWDGPPPAIWVLDLAAGKTIRLTSKGYFGWDPFWISADEFVFISQGEKENTPSIYRGSRNAAAYKLVLKNARTPSVSRP